MCNLRCIHCYQRADRALPDELSLTEKMKLVDELDKLGVAAVALSGGEPTIHPHFLKIIHELSSRGIYTAVATNGMRFADKDFTLKTIKAGINYVEVSIDSVDPDLHDKFRGVKGCWDLAIKGIKNLVEHDISVGIATTVTKINYKEIHDMVKLAEELGVNRVVFFNFIPVGRGRDIINLDLSPEEREEVLRLIYYEAKRSRVQVVSTAPQLARVAYQLSGGKNVTATHFVAPSDISLKALAEFIGGCGAGRIYMAIQPNGYVTPCVFMPIIVGSIREESLEKIWLHSTVMRDLRNRELLKLPCGECPYKYVCGGCRARAYAYFNDYLQYDPGCLRAKLVISERTKQGYDSITIPSLLA